MRHVRVVDAGLRPLERARAEAHEDDIAARRAAVPVRLFEAPPRFVVAREAVHEDREFVLLDACADKTCERAAQFGLVLEDADGVLVERDVASPLLEVGASHGATRIGASGIRGQLAEPWLNDP